MRINIFTAVFFLSVVSTSYSQIGGAFGGKLKTLKDKAVDKAKDKTNDKVNDSVDKTAEDNLAEAEKDYDPASFKYAISFVDNAGLFEAKEKMKKHKKALLTGVQKADVNIFDLRGDTRKLNNSVKSAPGDAKPDADDVIDKSIDPVTHIRTGELFYASSRYKGAEIEFLTAKKMLGSKTSSADFARVESDLGLLYHTQGRFTEALERTNHALEIREKYFPESPELAVSLNNKAVLLKDLSEYLEAERLIEQSESINKKKVGDESLAYAINLNNKAMLYHELGRYEDAEKLMDECLSIASKNLGDKSANFIRLKINKAIILRDNEKLTEAEQIYLEAIKVKEKRLGKNHPDYAQLKSGVAALYMEMGEYDKVEENLKTAASIFKKKFGENHPSYATTMFELGHFYRVTDKLNDAQEKLKQALTIREETLGKEHPEYLNTQEEIALVKWQQGKTSEAYSMYNVIIEQTMDYVNTYFAAMSEKEKSKLWSKLQKRLFRYYSFAIATRDKNPDATTRLLNLHLSTKGMLLNSTNKIKTAILSSNNNALKSKYLDWLDKKENLARLYNYSKEELEEEEIDLASLEADANKQEKELASMSAEFSQAYRISTYDYKTIQDVLIGSEALVETIEFHKYDKKFTGEKTYAIFVIKGGSAKPELVLKENGADMDSKNSKYYKNCVKYKLKDKKSYDVYWSGIDEKIKDQSKVYVSLDGVYNQVNMNTLLTPSGTYLIDQKKLIFVTNSKDIVKIKKNNGKLAIKTATLIGNPYFGPGKKITPLPGTKKEVEDINKIIGGKYKTTTYVEKNATEANVKKTDSDILHIATHGYFMSDVDKSKSARTLGVETSKAKENPLLRSGLMFANAESVFDTAQVSHSTSDNGILTAYEAMNLDLSNTDLLVLSACETGLGDVKVGEGVYGLQRAFQIAGVKSLIMSLWCVDDNTTQQLMSAFYKNLSYGMSKEDAFIKAQKLIKSKYPEVKYWGALLLIESE